MPGLQRRELDSFDMVKRNNSLRPPTQITVAGLDRIATTERHPQRQARAHRALREHALPQVGEARIELPRVRSEPGFQTVGEMITVRIVAESLVRRVEAEGGVGNP